MLGEKNVNAEHQTMRRLTEISIVLLIACVGLLTQGCQCLTRRMWTSAPMVLSSTRYADSVKCYVNKDKGDEFYLEVTTEGSLKRFRVKIDFSFSADRSILKKAELFLSDYSAVPAAQRGIVDYDFLIMKNTISRRFDDLEGYVLYFTGGDTEVTSSPSIPPGYTESKRCIVEKVKIEKWKPKGQTGFLGCVGKGIATPFTIVADLLVVPMCYGTAYVNLCLHFPH
jgi:hypothetical protein